MGDRISRTGRWLRSLFKKEEAPPPKLEASQIIRPEMTVPHFGKRAPKSTTRRLRRDELEETRAEEEEEIVPPIVVEKLPWGVTHVRFRTELDEDDTAVVRDPVTRRLSRKKLNDGMRKTTGYYDARGRLLSEREARW